MVKARVPLILGSANFGASESKDITRISEAKDAQAIVDIFAAESDYKEVDSSRRYGGGNSEKMLSKLELYGARVDTKINLVSAGDHEPAKLRATLSESLGALGVVKIRTLYLHAPDRATPYESTVEEIDRLYKEGKFEAFGLSNFTAWEVAEIYTLCRERNYIRPTVYQGRYNLLSRTNEDELFPALRKYDIRFIAYSILGGGLLKGDPTRPGGRFDPTTAVGAYQNSIYGKPQQQEVVEQLKALGQKHDLTIGEIALRWAQHHSKLRPTDGIIIGASNPTQLKENIKHSEKDPLPEEVVQAIESAWLHMKSVVVHYRKGPWPEYPWA